MDNMSIIYDNNLDNLKNARSARSGEEIPMHCDCDTVQDGGGRFGSDEENDMKQVRSESDDNESVWQETSIW